MTDEGVDSIVLNDPDFFATLAEHRRYWNRLKGVEYDTLYPPNISFIPSSDILNIYRKDYQTMQESMIYEPYLEFDMIVEKLLSLNARFNEMKRL